MKRALWKFGVVTLVLLGALLPQPSHAALATGGALAFQGQARLPIFPCETNSVGTLPCSGTFTGTIAGNLSGVYNNVPWAIAVAAPITATNPISFNYADGIQPGIRCVEGVAAAQGTVTADQTQSQVNGVYGSVGTNPLTLPRSVVYAEVTFRFNWYRVGTTANLRFDLLRVRLKVFGSDTLITVVDASNLTTPTGVVGYGAAGFSPTATTDFQRLEAACNPEAPGPNMPLVAEVAGNADFDVVSQ